MGVWVCGYVGIWVYGELGYLVGNVMMVWQRDHNMRIL